MDLDMPAIAARPGASPRCRGVFGRHAGPPAERSYRAGVLDLTAGGLGTGGDP